MHSYYETLNLSADASREEIEKACVALWYRYQSMRGTPLWQDISSQIEQIHATLTDARARAAYDARRVTANSPGADPAPEIQPDTGETSPAVATFAEAAPDAKAPLKPRMNLRRTLQADGLMTAFGFNQSLDWLPVEDWSDIATGAVLTLSLCIAATFLVWSILHLRRMKRENVAV